MKQMKQTNVLDSIESMLRATFTHFRARMEIECLSKVRVLQTYVAVLRSAIMRQRSVALPSPAANIGELRVAPVEPEQRSQRTRDNVIVNVRTLSNDSTRRRLARVRHRASSKDFDYSVMESIHWIDEYVSRE